MNDIEPDHDIEHDLDNDIEPVHELDCDWINTFHETERNYINFYKDTPQNIKIFFYYVNKENALENTVSKNLHLNKEGVLEKKRLLAIINKNKAPNYKLRNILKYNFTLDPENVHKYISSHNPSHITVSDSNEYLINYNKNIQDIKFNNTIKVAQKINALFLIFTYHKKLHNNTKKVYKIKKVRNTRRILSGKSI